MAGVCPTDVLAAAADDDQQPTAAALLLDDSSAALDPPPADAGSDAVTPRHQRRDRIAPNAFTRDAGRAVTPFVHEQ
jgi:hypothetical protein